MKRILAIELLLLATGVAWLLATPDGPAVAAPVPPFGADRPGLDDYAWQVSLVVLKLSPALLILYGMYLGLRYVQHKHEVEKIRAHRPIPESVTHLTQPRITHNPHYPAQPLPLAPSLLKDHTPPIEVPSFAQLLERGLVGPGQPLILGYTDQGPLTGSWKDLYSSAVAGIPGSGKTTTVRFLAAQAALHGAKFAILDPHADTGEESLAATLEPLQPVMLCEPAMHERDMLAVAKLMQAQLDARLQGSTDRTPILLAIDEYTRLMRSSIAGPISGVVEAIAQEGRKVGIFCTLSGQSWTAPRAGGTPLRDSLASVYCHRLRRNQARLLLSTDEARIAETLEPGRALLLRTNGDCGEVAIPLATIADVERVGALLATPAQSARNGLATEDSAVQSHKALSPKEAQVISMLQGGATVPEVVKVFYGTTGAAYTAGVKEVSAIIGQALREQMPT